MADETQTQIVKTWTERGFTSQQADDWTARQFSLEDAVEWNAIGMSPKDAKFWRNSHFTPSQAKSWVDAGVIDEARASHWMYMGFTDPEKDFVSIWIWLGITPETAERHRNRKEVIRRSLAHLPEDAPDLIDYQPSRELSGEASTWQHAGFDEVDAKQWVERKFSLRAAEAWRAHGVSAKEAFEWRMAFDED
jgi:hypothetical protein